MVKDDVDAYLLCGEDGFSREEAQKRLIARQMPSGPSLLDYDTYDARNDSTEIFNTLSTLPFTSGKRVVVIKEIEALPEPRKKPFLSYLQNPQREIFLVMHSGKNISDDRFLKNISAYARTETFRKPGLSEAKDWIQKRVRREKKTITRDALDLIIELKGRESLEVLSREVEKLLIYKSADKIIKAEDVFKLVGKSALRRAFELVDAVSRKDKDSAMLLVHELTSSGRKAVPETLGLMGWQFRRILKAKAFLARGMSRQSLSSELGVRAFSMERLLRQVSRFTEEELKRDFGLLVEADRDIKRSRNRPDFILEELIVRLCCCP